MKMVYFRGIPLLLLASLVGCGGVSVKFPGAQAQNPEGSPTPETSSAEAVPPAAIGPGKEGRPSRKEEASLETALRQVRAGTISYRIGPADLLEISVYQEKDLERKVRVSPDGTVTLPLIGGVKLGGLDTAGAERAITEKLTRFLKNPQVSVFIKEYANRLIYVLGEVKNPGSYPLPTEGPMSVLEAVTLAGGFTPYADKGRTRVIRRNKESNQNIPIDITAITKGGDKSKDVLLEPNDVVFIPETFF